MAQGLLQDQQEEAPQEQPSGLLQQPGAEPVESPVGSTSQELRSLEASRMLSHTGQAQEVKKRTGLGLNYPPEKNDNPFSSVFRSGPAPLSDATGIGKDNPFSHVLAPKSPIPTYLPPQAEALGTPGSNRMDVNVVDFLFGGEMAVAGMKYDNSGLHWNLDIAKQQWSEQPLWLNLLNTTSLVGTMAFPAARAVATSAKFGKMATLGKRLAGLSKLDEIKYFKGLGILEGEGEVTAKTLELARRQESYRSRYMDIAQRLEKGVKGEGPVSWRDKIQYQFDKRFANKYFEIAGSLIDGQPQVRDTFYRNLDELFRSEDMGKFFVNVPDEEAGARVYQYRLNKLRPGILSDVKLNPNEKAWADMMDAAGRSHQQEALESGMITADTFDRVGEVHIPALGKETPRPDLGMTRRYYLPTQRKALPRELAAGLTKDSTVEVLRPFEMPRLDSPTLKPRMKDLPEVAQRLLSGELITDPMELTVRGHVMDRLLLNNYKTVTHIATDDRYAVAAHDIFAKFGGTKAAEKAGYVSLDKLQGNIPTTLKRMIEKANPAFLGSGGELPWVRKSVYEDMFGEAGIFAQSQMASNVLHVLTIGHKTAKTALSIPTHFQNIASNVAFLSQAGFNVFAPENIKTMQKMSEVFTDIAKAHRNANEIAKAAGMAGPKRLEDLGLKLGKFTIGGKEFDLTKELLDPKVRELMEESAFENVEGFQALSNLAKRMPDGVSKSVAKTLIGAKKILQLGDREGFRWFDKMTQWYLGEDMVPKMTYYMGLRGQGLTKDAAILEVGRRMPMYGTVGSAIKKGRRWLFPWATFPAEAMRITKNNLMDYPLRMMPWLHLPHIMQAFGSVAGFGPGTTEEAESAKRQLPLWAQTPQTVMTTEGAGNKIGLGLTGGLAGGIAGAIKGGPLGALGGAVAGAGAAQFLSDTDNAQRLRGAVLNWLPHTSFYLKSTSPEFAGDGALPFRDFQGLLEQVPAEPLAILKPLMDIAYGKTAWGEDMGGYDVGDTVGKGIAGLIGFVSPPFIQKYGLKTTTPDISLSEYLTGEPIAGDISNVSRLLIDSGLKVDPSTGKPGNITNELFLKNFGAWKAYATDPAYRLANEQGADYNFQKIRSEASKNLGYYLENGEDNRSTELLGFVMSTFSNQYADDPKKAQEQYGKWLKTRIKQIGRHPRLRGWSEDEIKQRLDEVSRFSGDERGKAREEMMTFLNNQLTVRKLQRLKMQEEQGLKVSKNKRGRTTGIDLGYPQGLIKLGND